MTPLAFTLTQDEAIRAARFGARCVAREYALRTALIIAGFSALLVFGIGLWDGVRLSLMLEYFVYTFLSYAALVLVITLLAQIFNVPRKIRRNFRHMPALGREQRISWDDAVLVVESDNGDARLKFAELHKYAANQSCVLIFPTDGLHYIIPASIFPDPAQFSALVGLLQSHGVRRI